MSDKRVITIGNFDGLHRGHQVLLKTLLDLREKYSCSAAVMSFDPHPVQVLHPDREVHKLFDLDDLEETALRLGADEVIIEKFDQNYAHQTAKEFFCNQLIGRYGAQALVVGYDFAFGAGREGSSKTLQLLGDEFGVEVHVVPPVEDESHVISSSRIRQALRDHKVGEATQLLGRPYYLRGPVVRGEGRGASIGIPTANIQPTVTFSPGYGVYLTKTWVQGTVMPSITNVGINPTFRDKGSGWPTKVETLILDYDQSIYGEQIQIDFLDFLRPEMKFESVDQLIQQIGIDLETARKKHQ